MIIRCHGTRGSIPVSGAEYLYFGGDTTCFEVASKNGHIIIIDAGTGIRKLGNRLLAENQKSIDMLFTHSHWDHIMGFPFFLPLFQEDISIRISGCPRAQGNLKKILSQLMEAPYFQIPFERLKAKISYSDMACLSKFYIDSIEIHPIKLSHPNMGLGFKFIEDGKSFVFLTDNELQLKHKGGLTFRDYANFALNSNLLIHDAEYTPDQYKMTKGWGHSTYIDALDLAMKSNVKQIGLCHHNQDRIDRDQKLIVKLCQDEIKKDGKNLTCFALSSHSEILL